MAITSTQASLLAGVFASIVGLAVFLIIHHIWIKAIWFIVPAGLPIAVAGAWRSDGRTMRSDLAFPRRPGRRCQ